MGHCLLGNASVPIRDDRPGLVRIGCGAVGADEFGGVRASARNSHVAPKRNIAVDLTVALDGIAVRGGELNDDANRELVAVPLIVRVFEPERNHASIGSLHSGAQGHAQRHRHERVVVLIFELAVRSFACLGKVVRRIIRIVRIGIHVQTQLHLILVEHSPFFFEVQSIGNADLPTVACVEHQIRLIIVLDAIYRQPHLRRYRGVAGGVSLEGDVVLIIVSLYIPEAIILLLLGEQIEVGAVFGIFRHASEVTGAIGAGVPRFRTGCAQHECSALVKGRCQQRQRKQAGYLAILPS